MAVNNVNYLMSINFKSLPLKEKTELKQLGRPMPFLDIHQEDKVGSRTYIRRFSAEVYKKNDWVCGCDIYNALFCFPCVLFYSENVDKIWGRMGFKDLKHVNERMRRHQITAGHLNSCTEFALLGSVNIPPQLNSVNRENILKHNEQVAKNRSVLKKMINYCSGKFSLAEKDFSAELDNILKEHSTIFKVSAKNIQNDIFDSMLTVCRQAIIDQINESEFISIECDETIDVSNHCQLSFIVRYLYNGNIYERFWSFLKLTDESSKGIAQTIENELEILIPKSPFKLISQSYDGTNRVNGVPIRIKIKYNQAHFVHSYAHPLNLIIQKATSVNSKVKMFFMNLSSIASFFSNSTHKCDIFENIVSKNIPSVVSTLKNYNIRTVNVVFENLEELIICFKELEEKCNKTITCKEAYALRRTLEDPDFLFCLDLFHKVLPHVETLNNQFQVDKTTPELQITMEDFEKKLTMIVDSLDIKEENPGKRRKVDNKDLVIAKSICEIIISHLKELLKYRGHLEAVFLLNVSNFIYYSQAFPTMTFNSVIGCYPVLDKDKLKNELEVIYARRDFKNVDKCSNILTWLCHNGLDEIFSETVRLLKIILTTPMCTDESERCFSTLTRLKTFLRNAMNEECLDALAMLSVNEDLIHSINDFDEKVMENFILANDKRSQFEYKQ